MVKLFVNTVANSAQYTINSLLEMQAKAGDNNISIPLLVNKKHANQDASLLLRVKQPTATFISKRLQEEAERRFIQREEKEGRLSGSSSARTSISEPIVLSKLLPYETL
ncbi:hypothetical protein C0992_011670 [Termitomyces sp. T32_za158]|nr:hypothetical protein C0992_011670 [Termitomyces sp. T32_za158]